MAMCCASDSVSGLRMVEAPVIRLASVADAEQVGALHAESWRSAYRGLLPDGALDGDLVDERQQTWAERLAVRGEQRLTWLLVEDEAPVAFLSLVLDEDPVHGHLIDNLHVRPHLKSRGHGRRLLAEGARAAARHDSARPLHLLVLDGNWPAARFYERLGAGHVETLEDDHLSGTRVRSHRYRWADAGALLAGLGAAG
jgi:ribosomal protein S18 acetylase RimI-like enzyme